MMQICLVPGKNRGMTKENEERGGSNQLTDSLFSLNFSQSIYYLVEGFLLYRILEEIYKANRYCIYLNESKMCIDKFFSADPYLFESNPEINPAYVTNFPSRLLEDLLRTIIGSPLCIRQLHIELCGCSRSGVVSWTGILVLGHQSKFRCVATWGPVYVACWKDWVVEVGSCEDWSHLWVLFEGYQSVLPPLGWH